MVSPLNATGSLWVVLLAAMVMGRTESIRPARGGRSAPHRGGRLGHRRRSVRQFPARFVIPSRPSQGGGESRIRWSGEYLQAFRLPEFALRYCLT